MFFMRCGMALAFNIFMTIWTVSLKQRFNFAPRDHAFFMGWVSTHGRYVQHESTYCLLMLLSIPLALIRLWFMCWMHCWRLAAYYLALVWPASRTVRCPQLPHSHILLLPLVLLLLLILPTLLPLYLLLPLVLLLPLILLLRLLRLLSIGWSPSCTESGSASQTAQ